MDLPAQAPVLRSAVLDAPTREVWGLSLGLMGAKEVESWLAERNVRCKGRPAPRRATVHHRCSDVSGGLLLDRTVPDAVGLLLARPDDGPLHHVSALRRYGQPSEAVTDYQRTLISLTARLGQPHQTDTTPPTAAAFASERVYFSSKWTFADLEVGVVLSRLTGPKIVVRERWDVPGVEATVGARVAGKVHGGVRLPHSPHGIVMPTGADSLPALEQH